jgi:hypothetical protein
MLLEVFLSIRKSIHPHWPIQLILDDHSNPTPLCFEWNTEQNNPTSQQKVVMMIKI